MLHDDILHILLYILIWLIFRFPTVKYANTKHGGAGVGGYHFVSIAHSISSLFYDGVDDIQILSPFDKKLV